MKNESIYNQLISCTIDQVKRLVYPKNAFDLAERDGYILFPLVFVLFYILLGGLK